MARQDRDEVTLIDAAGEIGISRGALYGRVQRAKKRGEPVPFRKRGKQGRLVAGRKAFDTWAARWATTDTRNVADSPPPPQEPPMTREDADIATPSSSPSSSSGNAVGDPLATSAEALDLRALLEPVPTVGAPVIDDLPSSYMEDRVTTLLLGPDRIAVYWDLHPETAKAHAGVCWGILVRSAGSERVIEIEHGARNWYIDIPGVGVAHEVYFGPIHDGSVRSVAQTALIPDPAAGGSEEAGSLPDDEIRWGHQATVGAASLVEEPPTSAVPSEAGASIVAAVDTEELRRVSSDGRGSGSSGGVTSPGLSPP